MNDASVLVGVLDGDLGGGLLLQLWHRGCGPDSMLTRLIRTADVYLNLSPEIEQCRSSLQRLITPEDPLHLPYYPEVPHSYFLTLEYPPHIHVDIITQEYLIPIFLPRSYPLTHM